MKKFADGNDGKLSPISAFISRVLRTGKSVELVGALNLKGSA
jgi:hypothetical protein